MLHATLKLFLPAAYVGWIAATATRATSKAAVLMILLRLTILLRDARIRSLHMRAVIEAARRAPETGQARESPHQSPGLLSRRVSPATSRGWTASLGPALR